MLKLEGKHKKKPTDGTKKSVDEKRETFKQVDEQIADLANKAQVPTPHSPLTQHTAGTHPPDTDTSTSTGTYNRAAL